MCGEKIFFKVRVNLFYGSPLRVREKEHVLHTDVQLAGITPACAGKSHGLPTAAQGGWDHPRVCGEKLQFLFDDLAGLGSPPRVRRKGRTAVGYRLKGRITPACAGKRQMWSMLLASARDHPRVCGEKMDYDEAGVEMQGSPPRVRGKGVAHQDLIALGGITPAYAGKSRKT